MTWPFPDRLGSLVRKARQGDRDAFRKLYAELHPSVHAFAARRCRTAEDAEDVTARTFQALVESLERIDASRGVLPWVLSIARNLLIDAARAHRPGASLDELGAALVEQRTPLGELLQAEELRSLGAAVAALPPDARELIALRFGDGLAHRDIARLLGIAEAAVRQRLSRVLRELRASGLEKGELAHDS